MTVIMPIARCGVPTEVEFFGMLMAGPATSVVVLKPKNYIPI